jgi:hypothetical protein
MRLYTYSIDTLQERLTPHFWGAEMVPIEIG